MGLFLQGGGALGAWQAGALEALDAAGVRFDAVMGFSIGVVNGAALAFGRLPDALERWRRLDGGILKFRPRLKPFALFSDAVLHDFFRNERDDAVAKAALKIDFTVLTACAAEDAPLNARYTPEGRGDWDAPFVGNAVASCSIPVVFPPVDLDYRGRRVRLYDAGVQMRRPFDLSPLAHCADVLVLEMVREDEMGRLMLWHSLDQSARETSRRLVDAGLAGLAARERPPRVFRLAPSRRLGTMMLDFRGAGIRAMLAQGGRDAADYWKK